MCQFAVSTIEVSPVVTVALVRSQGEIVHGVVIQGQRWSCGSDNAGSPLPWWSLLVSSPCAVLFSSRLRLNCGL